MALISAKTIIISISLFHITLGFFFLTSPITVADQALVWLLGEATGMPYSRSFDAPSAALSFLAVILASLGISDLVTLNLPEEVCLIHYWGTQAPLRLVISVLLVFYSFFFSGSSPLPRHLPPAAGDGLQNRVFFTFMFVELISWLWIVVTLREERAQVLARKATRRRSYQAHAT
ncbi:Increased loss of mitochondrial DNA protein 1 [Niveomyces insectorum RCEF 264]|uniref:Increased loss of mitochondrial DNA protein 1 n=1 Tax=Niveomyces insectorum RCEF 264 TaxID=1081102 RepID=A0A167UN91_9HYPO|nr:Increased loss of mitochondrial DNA protein 1 [Niveomyces insectorum RCEF 264]